MRRTFPLIIGLTLTIVCGQALAACDTGDGKTLRPADPNATTTSTEVASIDTGTLSSIPLEDDLLSGAGGLPGASLGQDASTGTEPEGFRLFAPWLDGAQIDQRYTCDGDDVSPALSWKSPPDGTEQLAFALVDESSVVDGRPFIHWAIAGIEPADISLIEGSVPPGAVQGINSFGEIGWSGPCPPIGNSPHIYRMTMYALNQQVELADGVPATELLDFIEAVTIGSTDLTATYQR